MEEFYSNGKLLLSGEYAILDGALGMAIPTKYGQHLRITDNSASIISWKSLDEAGNTWFEGSYDLNSLLEISASNKGISKTVSHLLSEIKRLSPDFFNNLNGCEVETKLTFQKDWGLGSSSTLINNLANWTNVNAYHLLKSTFGGSGYDIACAQHDSPILFHLENNHPKIQEIEFNPPFKNELYFIYLNKKQNSREGIAQYRNSDFDKRQLVENLSAITSKMLLCENINVFEKLINEHETLLSEALDMPKLKDVFFSDYDDGAIKSLGAWGGDFFLATGNEHTPHYFMKKGFHTIIPYNEMAL